MSLNPAVTPDDVWRPSPHNVPELHEKVAAEILRGVARARTDDTSMPLGVAMQGRAGAGKTHLLGAVRERIQREGGYFFLVDMVSGKTFWESVALALVEGMGRAHVGWGTQLKTFLRRLTPQLGLPVEVRDAVAGARPVTRAQLDTFIWALRERDREVGRDAQDTARALVLHGAIDFEAQDVGYAHLISEPGDPAARAQWGLSAAIRTPQQVVQDISRLMALTLDPTVIAVDQLDTLFAQTSTSLLNHHQGLEDGQAKVLGPIADGLLKLRDITRRTLVVVSCLPDTWVLMTRSAPTPVGDRFRTATLPDRIPTPEIGQAIVAKRLAAAFAGPRFVPPHPTWPIASAAFADAPTLTPRALLRRVDRHIAWCRDRDEVVELDRLIDGADSTPTVSATRGAPGDPTTDERRLHELDARFAELVDAADVSGAVDPAGEDEHMPPLLAAGLAAWIAEQSPTGATYKYDPPPGRKPALHGRLIEVLDEATENEAHWCFRAIAHPNAIAVTARVKAACTLAGLDRDLPQRRLILLRNGPWPTGKRTTEVLTGFDAAGGVRCTVPEADLRVFAALRVMAAEPSTALQEWLVARRPASGTELFRTVLPGPDGTRGGAPPTAPDDGEPPSDGSGPDPTDEPVADVAADPSSGSAAVPADVVDLAAGVGGRAVGLGWTVDGGRPFRVPLESLRRHAVVFAGSGSGKTVLIRRLVEECAREGVSAIVLDPNNDLARLGDAWPDPPGGWGPGDAERAADYLAHTEVVVWTPRVSAGRPLSFQPLPDFTSLRDWPDEFDQAVDSAVEALAPRAGVDRSSRLAQQGKAVLTRGPRRRTREAAWWACPASPTSSPTCPRGSVGWPAPGSSPTSWPRRSRRRWSPIRSSAGVGAPADPGLLLTPSAGRRARVSVISFVGLTSDEQRQSFVNQLQMALFAWIKRHPAGDRPLGGLFVMDEAQTLAPSTGTTACTASTIALASQARKYGLGLVFATQAPKGLHNQISGNATTQFFGLLNAPAQIDAARQLAEAKGGRLPDIGLLNSGEFYAAGEGFSFVKVRTPLCLTHHPKAPLTPEDVVARARPAG